MNCYIKEGVICKKSDDAVSDILRKVINVYEK